MSVTQRYRNGIAKRLARAAAFAFCLGVCGCLMDSPSDGSADAAATATDPGVGPKALRDQSAPDTGIPRGCTREWNQAAMDSLLYCPDVRPPKPR
ncbi:MAG: hypothetical protein JWO30_3904 [Fibrobacteres bacterium]|nr:hypothetical protein [Fibrobacterota bacterium]